jgi:hypothetical protein
MLALVALAAFTAFGDNEGRVLDISSEGAHQWFADDSGNIQGATNVSWRPWPRSSEPTSSRGRIAIIQSGAYNTWQWQPTVEAVIRPAIADGWEVDYFGYFQRGPVHRYSESEGRADCGKRRTAPWNETVAEFMRDMAKEGVSVRSLRTSKASADAFIGKRFAQEKPVNPNMATVVGCSGQACHESCDPKTQNCDPPHTGQHDVENQWCWNVLLAFRSFQTYTMTTAQPVPYTWVLRIREDAGYYADVNISIAKVGVTYVRPCMMYGGVSDKGFLSPPEHAMLVAQDMVAARWAQLNHQYQENVEQLMWEVLNYNDIPFAPITADVDRPENAFYYNEAGPQRRHAGLVDFSTGKPNFNTLTGKMETFGLTVSDARITDLEANTWCLIDRYFAETETPEKDFRLDQGPCSSQSPGTEQGIQFTPGSMPYRLCSQVPQCKAVANKQRRL